MGFSLTPKNWGDFQHYKNRRPPWIKLHHTLLDDYEFARLPVASRALAPLLWLLASEYQDGTITLDIDALSFRLRMTESELKDHIKPLIDSGFFICASGLLAPSKQDALLETETQVKAETKDDADSRARPLISEQANNLSDEITVLAGHDPAFVPPSWYGSAWRIQEWLNQDWKPEVILLSVREQMAKKRGKPPDRVQYFEKGIADAIARQNSPLPAIPEVSRNQHAKSDRKSVIASIQRLHEQVRSGNDLQEAGAVVLSLPTGPVQRP